MKKLNQKGIAHLLAITAVVVGVAAVGTYFLVSSNANSLSSEPTVPTLGVESSSTTGAVASTASRRPFNCPGKAKPVSITTKDVIAQGKIYKTASEAASKYGYYIVCVNKTAGRKVTYFANNKTISSVSWCVPEKEFAFDLNNPDGKGYDANGTKWFAQTKSFGKKITIYCIDRSKMGKTDRSASDYHQYKWQPIVDLSKGCNSKERRYGGCAKGWFFSYAGSSDEYRSSDTWTPR